MPAVGPGVAAGGSAAHPVASTPAVNSITIDPNDALRNVMGVKTAGSAQSLPAVGLVTRQPTHIQAQIPKLSSRKAVCPLRMQLVRRRPEDRHHTVTLSQANRRTRQVQLPLADGEEVAC
jgi:hypothetical protein